MYRFYLYQQSMNRSLILDHLEKLIVLDPIARLGTLKAAAEELHIAQPSLSFKVAQLEKTLGVELLERQPRGVQLTEKGQAALSFVQEVLRHSDELVAALEKDPQKFQGTLKVGLYDSIARYFWPKFFLAFSKSYPGIKVLVTTGRSRDLFRLLLERRIDLCMTVGSELNSKIKTIELYQDSFSLFIASTLLKRKKMHLVGRGTSLKLDDFLSLDLFLFTGALSFQMSPLLGGLTEPHQREQAIHDVESFEIALEFCLQELGIAVLPNKVAQRDLDSGRLRKVTVQGLSSRAQNFSPHSICLSALNSQANRPLMVHTIHEIQKACSS